MERPICLASNAPPRNQTCPLISANSHASAIHNTSHLALPTDDLLSQRKWRHDLVIFHSAGRKNAGNCMALAGDFNLFSRMASDPCRQALTEENALRAVIRPLTLNPPPGMRYPNSGHEVLFSELNMPSKISSEQGRVRASKVHANRQHRSEPHDVIAPKHA